MVGEMNASTPTAPTARTVAMAPIKAFCSTWRCSPLMLFT